MPQCTSATFSRVERAGPGERHARPDRLPPSIDQRTERVGSVVGVHDARHTYASLMLRRGVPIVYISKQLGHSSIQVTVDLYGHFIPGADRHHVEGLADAIEEAGRQLAATQPQPDPTSRRTPRRKFLKELVPPG